MKNETKKNYGKVVETVWTQDEHEYLINIDNEHIALRNATECDSEEYSAVDRLRTKLHNAIYEVRLAREYGYSSDLTSFTRITEVA